MSLSCQCQGFVLLPKILIFLLTHVFISVRGSRYIYCTWVLCVLCSYFIGLFYAGQANLRCGATPFPSLTFIMYFKARSSKLMRNRSQLQLNPLLCPLLVCWPFLPFSYHSTSCTQNTFLSRLKTTQKQNRCPKKRSKRWSKPFRIKILLDSLARIIMMMIIIALAEPPPSKRDEVTLKNAIRDRCSTVEYKTKTKCFNYLIYATFFNSKEFKYDICYHLVMTKIKTKKHRKNCPKVSFTWNNLCLAIQS